MKWILGNGYKDVWLWLPGIAGIALVAAYPLSVRSAALLFITFALIDAGHVYTTVLRTHWRNPNHANRRQLNFISLGLFAAVTLWCLTSAPGLWMFVAYATIFHHVRQHYGIVRWYDGANSSQRRPWEYWLFYALLITGFVALHFRHLNGDLSDILYSKNDFFVYPNTQAFRAVTVLYAGLLLTWLTLSSQALRRSRALWPVKIYEFSAIATYAWAGFFAPDFVSAALPLFFSHGIPYMALISLTLPRTRPDLFKNIRPALLATLAIALVCGSADWLVETSTIENIITEGTPGLKASLIVGLYLTPLLSHYIYDGIIWRRKYSESQAIYAADAEFASRDRAA